MPTFIHVFAFLVMVLLAACSSGHYDQFDAFDASLDTLIKEPVVYARDFTLLEGDTLYGDPRRVHDAYHYRSSPDSTWQLAQTILLTFRDHELVRSALMTADHDTVTFNNMYYQEKIDNEKIHLLAKHYTSGDSIVRGFAMWYDKKGNKVKSVETGPINSRTLKVFRYDSLNRLVATWQRTHYPPELADTLWKTRTIQTIYTHKQGFEIPATRTTGVHIRSDSTEARNIHPTRAWRYERDSKGNWTRRERADGLEMVERKIVY